MKLIVLFEVLTLLCSSCGVQSARILGIFHYPSRSHHILGSTLLKALASRGHQVTMISPFRLEGPFVNYTEIEITGVVEEDANFKDKILEEIQTSYGRILSTFKILETKLRYAEVLHHKVFKDLLRSNAQFDIIIQFWAASEAFVGVAERFQAPIIGFSAIGGNYFINYHLNAPAPFSYVPSHMLPYPDEMDIFQKVKNTLVNLSFDIFLKFHAIPYQKRLYNRVFPNGKPFEEALDKVDLFLINSNVATESPRPYLPNMIQIGGFHIEENANLPPDLKEFLDSSPEGVIYFSFGTNIKATLLLPKYKQAFLKVFSKLKMKVLWKWEEDLLEKPENVKIGKWFPQADVLAHRNVKLFITHGGMGSVTEAIYYGVPFIGVPFFVDQENNVAASAAKGIAINIKHQDLSEKVLEEAIEKILNNPSYKKNIQARSSVYREQPIKPIDKAIYWVEHVLKHGGAKHLKASASKLSFYQYYLLDVIACVLGALLVLVLSVCIALSTTLRLSRKLFHVEPNGNGKLKAK